MFTRMRLPAIFRPFCLACGLTACSVGPVYQAPSPAAPERYAAPLPLASSGVAADIGWWASFDDPLLAELVAEARRGSPELDQALARIAQARALVAATRGGALPSLALDASSLRGKTGVAPGISVLSTSSSAGLDASWEIDLYGGLRKGADAAQARLDARVADWHGAQASLAAEVANAYIGQRACEATVLVLAQDSASREQTARLTAQKIQAGLGSQADGMLIDASSADGRQRLVAQRAECDLNIKALVALTGIAEAPLRSRLAAGADHLGHALPKPAAFTVPANALTQRPDIAAAERELAAASADINVAQANRYPRLSLSGNIGATALNGVSGTSVGWSFGPSLSLPLFDGGRRRAGVEQARARFDEADATYRRKVRAAVREIEEALVRLDAADRRETDADAAARGYERYLHVSADKFNAGSGDLFELEDARRTALASRQTVIALRRERLAAWIALYKAVGGGWSDAAATSPSST